MDWLDAAAPGLGEPVVVQTGVPQDSTRWPNITQHRTLKPAAFEATFRAATVVISHAGIGTILSAQQFGKPLILLPRRHDLGEHRNDHQLATARALDGTPGLHVAWDLTDLARLVADRAALAPASNTPGPERARLITGLAAFIGQS
jgi:UDP-N-acetylglucosamine transferase subunit ALG13